MSGTNIINYRKICGKPPLTAVPVMPENPSHAALLAEKAVREGADLIEFRADRLFSEGNAEQQREALPAACRAAGTVPVIYTMRTAAEGGLADMDDAVYAACVREALECEGIIYADIELSRPCAGGLISLVHGQGRKVILSRHSFTETPDYQEIVSSFRQMENMGADIAKCAFMPKDFHDADVLLAASADCLFNLNIPHIAVSMGETGLASRLAGEVFGSCITFGCLKGEASAPGQMEIGALRTALENISAKRTKGSFIFLTGFMGAGKSAVSRRLRDLTGLPVIEMDAMIEKQEGCSISEIFAARGETYFRDLETHLLSGLYDADGAIVSCGGGVPLRAENRALMKALGKTVLLKAQPETIYGRLIHSYLNRPNIRERMSVSGIRDLMEKRDPFYLDAADITVVTDGRPLDEICRETADALSLGCMSN